MAEIDALIARVISGSEIAINAGANKGIEVGDSATVWRSVEIQDPQSGASLGSFQRARLQLSVYLVDELFCLARIRVDPPNFAATIFGKQTRWITGSGVDEDENVRLEPGDAVTVYSADGPESQ